MTPRRANLLLFLAATIWGFAFVAQRQGMETVGPFTFNGLRFLLGGGALWVLQKRGVLPKQSHLPREPRLPGTRWHRLLAWPGLTAGLILTIGASLQQAGLLWTTAGNAGFITGLYVVFVPFFGLFLGQRPGRFAWAGAAAAVIGLYFLSITETFAINPGDLLQLIGALFWAIHVHFIGWVARQHDPVTIARRQFGVCGVLSLLVAVSQETITGAGVQAAGWALAYGGLMSVGIGYTLQVVAQRYAEPTPAAIILSLESPFALLGGWLLLSEIVTGRALVGCSLMLGGMILAQLDPADPVSPQAPPPAEPLASPE
jgi:drug/metabolite transporter (DMT)-like permease